MALLQAVATQVTRSLGFLSPRTSSSDGKVPSFTETWNAIQAEKGSDADAHGTNSPDIAKGRQKTAKPGDSGNCGLTICNLAPHPVAAAVVEAAEIANAICGFKEEQSTAPADVETISSARPTTIAFQLPVRTSVTVHAETMTSSMAMGNLPNSENLDASAMRTGDGMSATTSTGSISQQVVTPEAGVSTVPRHTFDAQQSDPSVLRQRDEKNQNSDLDFTQDASSSTESKLPSDLGSLPQEFHNTNLAAQNATTASSRLIITSENPAISSPNATPIMATDDEPAREVLSPAKPADSSREHSVSSWHDLLAAAGSNAPGGEAPSPLSPALDAAEAISSALPEAVETNLSAASAQGESGAPIPNPSPTVVRDCISFSLGGIEASASAHAGLRPQMPTSMTAGLNPSPAPAHPADIAKNDSKNSLPSADDPQSKTAPANASGTKQSSDDAKASNNSAASPAQIPTPASSGANSTNEPATAVVSAHSVAAGTGAGGNATQKPEALPEGAAEFLATHASVTLPATGPVQMAQILNKGAQSEMRIGMNTSAFGNVEVRTTVHSTDVGVVIGSERGDLRSLMANDLPAIANSLDQHNLRLNQVSFQSGLAFSSQSQSQSQGGSQFGRFSSPAAAPATSSSPETERESLADGDRRETRPQWHSGISILA